MNLKLPSIATTALGILLAALVALNDQVFHFGEPWTAGINAAVVWAGVFGVAMLAHGAFASIVKLTQAESAAIAGVLTFVQLALMQIDASSVLRTVLQCVLVVAATLGFEPALPATVRAQRSPAPGLDRPRVGS